MKFLLRVFPLLLIQASNAQLWPVPVAWDYGTNATFNLAWDGGFLVTTNRQATPTVSAGERTFSVKATVGLIESDPSVPLKVFVSGIVLESSETLSSNSWRAFATNTVTVTNHNRATFYRARIFIAP